MMVGAGENVSLTEQVATSVREMIVQSGARPGDRFCKEVQLEQKLGVSRNVVREAVSRLRALGVLDSRQGVGLIIGKPDPMGLFEQTLSNHALDSADLVALEELRYALEVGAVEIAVKRATPAHVERLASLAEEFADCSQGSSPDRTSDDVDCEFHRTILDATQSPMLKQMHSVLTVFFARRGREIPDYPVTTSTELSVWEHRMIVNAFRDHNTQYARILLSEHLARGRVEMELPGEEKQAGSSDR
jgi:GntR family transcriptional regulator, transcriptional repressor for pyruvate dehydrogenase complex